MTTISRRKLLQSGAAGLLTAATTTMIARNYPYHPDNHTIVPSGSPAVMSTWNFGLAANTIAWGFIMQGKSALDAVEQGVRHTEADPSITSVGYGGLPDSSGHVTLDACIMNHKGDCGSVVFMEHIMHPVSVARRVMEFTPHVMLAGQGALDFALSQGFTKQDLLTPGSLKAWQEWKKKQASLPQTPQNHDTIGMLAMDKDGNISGACSTSGLAFKMPGRIGDSPLIGAGLYVDNAVGAATATGTGEMIIRVAGSFLIVELMRQGMEPSAACKEAVKRIALQHPGKLQDIQAGFVALRKDGMYGGFGMRKNEFQYAVTHSSWPEGRLHTADSWL
jgi:N4-(beta-N-acetylglucosaminyl)-L-asparaginase